MYNNFEDAWNYFNRQIEERGILDQQLVHIDEAEKERIRKQRQDFRIKKSVTLLVIARGKAVPFVPNAVTSREGLNHAIRQLKDYVRTWQI
ncbi:hypothetical protein WN944_017553 [Citrus x changshan-huyou]|uniref:Uncharacterized protein n=1 Tax=Citrus x changshan-huyou TaxID=2935761 RepID=A0AAP0MBH9_9ROSI